MSSFTRTLQRRFQRRAKTYEAAPVAYKGAGPNGYTVLHPTKGWRRMAASRLRAQRRLADMAERIERVRGSWGKRAARHGEGQ